MSQLPLGITELKPDPRRCTIFRRFDHPPEAIQQTLQLQNTPYPRRPGEQHCSYYLKTSKCKFGATCRYDHPDLRPEHSTWFWMFFALLARLPY